MYGSRRAELGQRKIERRMSLVRSPVSFQKASLSIFRHPLLLPPSLVRHFLRPPWGLCLPSLLHGTFSPGGRGQQCVSSPNRERERASVKKLPYGHFTSRGDSLKSGGGKYQGRGGGDSWRRSRRMASVLVVAARMSREDGVFSIFFNCLPYTTFSDVPYSIWEYLIGNLYPYF